MQIFLGGLKFISKLLIAIGILFLLLTAAGALLLLFLIGIGVPVEIGITESACAGGVLLLLGGIHWNGRKP